MISQPNEVKVNSLRPEPKRTPLQAALLTLGVLSFCAQIVGFWAFHHLPLFLLLNTVAGLCAATANTLRARQLEYHKRESEPAEGEGSSGPEEQQPVGRRNPLSRSTRIVLFVELALVLTGGALHLLQLEGRVGLRSVTATTLLLAGSVSTACGILLHSLLRRLGTPEKWTDAVTAVGVIATLPLLCWLGYFAGRRNGHCVYQNSDGSRQDYTCAPQESGVYLLVYDIGDYLGWPVFGAAFMVALFIGAALLISLPDRGNRAILRWNLICAVLASALLATVFALKLGDAPKYDLHWSALAVLVVILPPAVHAIRRRVRLERMRKAGTPRERSP
ncbi:hypothetical protein LZ318_09095 [Saccharopolyspora indica]|uniref:hypothetical protein n=1 Tax=Saccharopolyspora indica TaxID=1229659 RepID=UPI0022EAF1F6|nr:hypothetical protein [Saccharopolyspora indica]MDA3643488.1 hypothetical protein [Saccharopolyspora indica]